MAVLTESKKPLQRFRPGVHSTANNVVIVFMMKKDFVSQ
jgi:hypothetical protein